MATWLDRYVAGERERVWQEMCELGAAIRAGAAFEDGMAVARETMRRVRANADVVLQRLQDIGYELEAPDAAVVAPRSDVVERIVDIETKLGPLPLSLRAFYEVVGAIDFRQSWKQIVPWPKREDRVVAEMLHLGEADPLVVHPIDAILDALVGETATLSFCFAPDEFHKANYSGGENYHLTLPDARADAAITGMYGVEETFVEHLRSCFEYGGFRGHIEPIDDERSRKEPPRFEVAKRIAAGLLPL